MITFDNHGLNILNYTAENVSVRHLHDKPSLSPSTISTRTKLPLEVTDSPSNCVYLFLLPDAHEAKEPRHPLKPTQRSIPD